MGKLVLTRCRFEETYIDVCGITIAVTPVELHNGKVRLQFVAPPEAIIRRGPTRAQSAALIPAGISAE